mmetsp:Transcript_15467/g.38625  ORF Transcript_15467/g.38625 Transcript_15467/m.38625 type:complete len:237 (-) Transcript_15467:1241-1951(-)
MGAPWDGPHAGARARLPCAEAYAASEARPAGEGRGARAVSGAVHPAHLARLAAAAGVPRTLPGGRAGRGHNSTAAQGMACEARLPEEARTQAPPRPPRHQHPALLQGPAGEARGAAAEDGGAGDAAGAGAAPVCGHPPRAEVRQALAGRHPRAAAQGGALLGGHLPAAAPPGPGGAPEHCGNEAAAWRRGGADSAMCTWLDRSPGGAPPQGGPGAGQAARRCHLHPKCGAWLARPF